MRVIPTLAASLLLGPLALPSQQIQPSAAAQVHREANFDAERAQANQLYLAGKALEALPLYEDLCRQDSTIAVFAERHGAGLFAKAGTVSDPAQHNALMTEGMKELQRAQSLGDNSPYVETAVSSIAKTPMGMTIGGPMGVLPLTVGYTYNGSAKAQPLFQQAEAAFNHKDLPTALKSYLAAAAADPAWYSPALYAGDMYYRLQDYPNAYLWYAKAIAIDPDRETAYRYWADALVKAGDMAGARLKAEQAYVAEPYTKSTWAALQQWTTLAHLLLTPPRVGRPQFTMKDGQFTETPLTVENGSGISSWLVYRESRLAHDPKVIFNQWMMSGAVSANPPFTFTPTATSTPSQKRGRPSTPCSSTSTPDSLLAPSPKPHSTPVSKLSSMSRRMISSSPSSCSASMMPACATDTRNTGPPTAISSSYTSTATSSAVLPPPQPLTSASNPKLPLSVPSLVILNAGKDLRICRCRCLPICLSSCKDLLFPPKPSQRHQPDRTSTPRTTSAASPGVGAQSFNPSASASSTIRSIGCRQACSARSNSPQWMGISSPAAPISRKTCAAPSGPIWIWRHIWLKAPISSMVRSNGPYASPISAKPSHHPESAP
jgi:tetratricopeptide (TPR) repeat protein